MEKMCFGEALVADRQAKCFCAHTWYVSCFAQSSVHPLTKSLPQHLQPCASLYALATMHFLLPANGFCMYLQIPRPSRARSTELCCPLRHVSQTADAAESSETGNWRKSEEIRGNRRSCRDCPLALRGNPGVFASGASVDRALGRTGSEGRRISSGMSPVCYQVLLLRLDIEPISAWSMAPVQTCRHCFLSPMRRNCQMPK